MSDPGVGSFTTLAAWKSGIFFLTSSSALSTLWPTFLMGYEILAPWLTQFSATNTACKGEHLVFYNPSTVPLWLFPASVGKSHSLICLPASHSRGISL
ncbi:MAG: hypothetical protein ACJATN_001604 [Neolewinella sp.]|jgi:hypothetical protein